MCKIFITATNTDIGKTYTTLKLIEYFKAQKKTVIALKPFESGVKETPLDSINILKTLDNPHLSLDNILFYKFELPASIYVANRNKIKFDYQMLKDKIDKYEKEFDVVLIEGAGGLYVPIELDFYMVDLIKFLDTKTLLVTSSKLGSINDTLLSIKALESYQIDFKWCINLHQDRESFYEITYPFYRDRFGEVDILQNDIEKITRELIL